MAGQGLLTNGYKWSECGSTGMWKWRRSHQANGRPEPYLLPPTKMEVIVAEQQHDDSAELRPHGRRRQWMRLYVRKSLSDFKWLLWIYVGIMIFSSWQLEFPAIPIVFTILVLALLNPLMVIAPLLPSYLARLPRVPAEYASDFKNALEVLFWILLFVYCAAAAWSLLYLLRFLTWLASWLTEHYRMPDEGALTGCVVSAFLATLYMLFRLILVRHLSLFPDQRKMPNLKNRLHLYTEAIWVFVLIATALVPAALRASAIPNLLCSVVIPVVILYAREDYRVYVQSASGVDRP
jgi:hypothetical protein